MNRKFFTLMFLALLVTHVVFASETIDGINYNLDASTRTATVAEGSYTGEIVIPEKVTFNNREYTVTRIGDGSFSFTSITSVVIPATISSIDNVAFNNCTSLNNVIIAEGCKTINTCAFYYCTSLLSISIPSSVTRIEERAFGMCTSLVSVDLSEGIEYIGTAAFGGCPKLTTITIPSSIKSMGNAVFYNCKHLSKIVWNAKNCSDFNSSYESPFSKYGKYNWENSIGGYDSNTTSGMYSVGYDNSWTTSITFGNEVEHIPAYLCYQFTGELRNLTIPDNVKTIGDYAFYGCSNLVSLKLGIGLIEIGKYTFANCSKLTSLTIPDNVTTINQYAFNGCTGLTILTLGKGVETLGTYSFGNGSNLTTINSYVVNPPYIDNTVFTSYDNLMAIDLNVREKALNAYKNALVWKQMHIDSFADDTRVFSLTVSSADNGKGVTSPSGKYDEDEEIVICALPKDGYSFRRWNDGNIQNPRIIRMTGDLSYIAYFVSGSDVTPSIEAYFVNIHGENCSFNISSQYPEGSIVSVDAVPDECYEFKQWSDGNNDNPRTITVTKDGTYTAEFNKLRYTVIGASSPAQGGKVEIKEQ